MFGLGIPEVFLIFVIGLFAYAMLMMIDAIRRPASQYTFGTKKVWITLFVLSNPMVTRYFGVVISTACLLLFIIAGAIYHVKNRWKNAITR